MSLHINICGRKIHNPATSNYVKLSSNYFLLKAQLYIKQSHNRKRYNPQALQQRGIHSFPTRDVMHICIHQVIFHSYRSDKGVLTSLFTDVLLDAASKIGCSHSIRCSIEPPMFKAFNEPFTKSLARSKLASDILLV